MTRTSQSDVDLVITEPDLDLQETARLQELFEACSWGWDTPARMLSAFRGSWCCLIATRGDAPIGFVRVLSDGAIYALVVDMLVMPESRNAGVGAALLDEVMSRCAEAGISIVKLIASGPDAMRFYQRAGFRVCDASSPGMLTFIARERSSSR